MMMKRWSLCMAHPPLSLVILCWRHSTPESIVGLLIVESMIIMLFFIW